VHEIPVSLEAVSLLIKQAIAAMEEAMFPLAGFRFWQAHR